MSNEDTGYETVAFNVNRVLIGESITTKMGHFVDKYNRNNIHYYIILNISNLPLAEHNFVTKLLAMLTFLP